MELVIDKGFFAGFSAQLAAGAKICVTARAKSSSTNETPIEDRSREAG
jgi:hypothetical protein